MAWNELHITTSDQHANELSDELNSLGAVAITFQDAGDQPIFEPSLETVLLWQETVVTALFEQDEPLDTVIRYLENQEALGKLTHFHLKHLPDENWERRCLEGFEPICCGKRLWICPSWHVPPHPDAVNIILDPGLAFGTGTHPTTQLCLEWLDEHIKAEDLIIDYGCGSGILGIAALKLGAKKALAIDIDPQALDATTMNAERNHLNAENIVTQLASEPISQKADILIANILANPLIKLASLFNELVKENGKIVLSGILTDQAADVLNAYNPWFNMEKPLIRKDWVCLHGTKKSPVSDKNLN